MAGLIIRPAGADDHAALEALFRATAMGSRIRWPVVWYVTTKTKMKADRLKMVPISSKVVRAVRLLEACLQRSACCPSRWEEFHSTYLASLPHPPCRQHAKDAQEESIHC